MDHNPSCVANRSSASQEIPWILWKPKVRYRIYKKRQPLVSFWNQIIPLYTPYPIR